MSLCRPPFPPRPRLRSSPFFSPNAKYIEYIEYMIPSYPVRTCLLFFCTPLQAQILPSFVWLWVSAWPSVQGRHCLSLRAMQHSDWSTFLYCAWFLFWINHEALDCRLSTKSFEIECEGCLQVPVSHSSCLSCLSCLSRPHCKKNQLQKSICWC